MTVAPDGAWAGRDDRACAGADTWLWFPTDWEGRALPGAVPEEAAQRCGRCPVRRQCREHAIHHEPYGVWAGMSEDQRRAARRNRGIRLRSWTPDDEDDQTDEGAIA